MQCFIFGYKIPCHCQNFIDPKCEHATVHQELTYIELIGRVQQGKNKEEGSSCNSDEEVEQRIKPQEYLKALAVVTLKLREDPAGNATTLKELPMHQ